MTAVDVKMRKKTNRISSNVQCSRGTLTEFNNNEAVVDWVCIDENTPTIPGLRPRSH